MLLEGLRLLDLCWLGPGPFTAQILGDMGFDVIRVTEVSKGAGRRGGKDIGTLLLTHNLEQLGQFQLGLRNSRAIAIDLKNPRGAAVFRRLVEKADAIQEGFRPGVADRLGIGYEALRAIKPDIVYAAVTGFGQTGPYREMGGHDVNYVSVAGVVGLNGRANGEPAIPGTLIGDFAAGGMSAAVHILGALLRRALTGKGAYCDVSITDAAFEVNKMAIGAFLASGREPKRGEAFYSGMYPWYDIYPTRDGKHIAVGAVEPYFYENLCRTLGREDLVDRQWDVENREQIRAEFAATFRSRTRAEWIEAFDGVDACVTPVNSAGDACSDPQMQARMLVEVDHPVQGRTRTVGTMLKFDAEPLEVRHWNLGPTQHTNDILAEHGYSESEIAELREQRAVA